MIAFSYYQKNKLKIIQLKTVYLFLLLKSATRLLQYWTLHQNMSEEKWVFRIGYGVQYHPLKVYSFSHVIQTENGSNNTAVAVSNNTLNIWNDYSNNTRSNIFNVSKCYFIFKIRFLKVWVKRYYKILSMKSASPYNF